MTTLIDHATDGVYVDREELRGRLDLFTVYCAMPDAKRGTYDEEIDVRARNPAHARRIAAAAIARDYDPALAPKRLVRRAPGVMFL